MKTNNSQAAYDYVYLGGQDQRRHQLCKMISSRGPHGHLCTVQFPDGQEVDVARWNVKNISNSRKRICCGAQNDGCCGVEGALPGSPILDSKSGQHPPERKKHAQKNSRAKID